MKGSWPHGKGHLSEALYFRCHVLNWKSKYGDMETIDVIRMNELEEENAQLKRMYSNLIKKRDIPGPVQNRKLRLAIEREFRDAMVLER